MVTSVRNMTLSQNFADYDFSKVFWICEQRDGDFIVIAVSPEGYTGHSTIDELTWKMLTPKGKQLLLKATITVAASNLIDQSKLLPNTTPTQEQDHD